MPEAQPGDKLVLTKGSAAASVTTAAKKQVCPPEILKTACASMVQLNAIGRDACRAAGGVHAVTDVTGFGLCGHSYEMADGSKVTLGIDLDKLPTLAGVEEHGLTRFRMCVSKSNSEYVAPHTRIEGKPNPKRLEYLWDPQTSGGLLISIAPENVDLLMANFTSAGQYGQV